jgi:hypothetical protein
MFNKLKLYTIKTENLELELLAKDSIQAIWTAQELLPRERIIRVTLTDQWFDA